MKSVAVRLSLHLFADEYRKLAGPDRLARIFARSETLGEINASIPMMVIVTRLIETAKANETVNLNLMKGLSKG
jgi:hypothetical protein